MFHIASSKGPPPIPEHFSHEARDFLKLCFTRNPKDRPNAFRLLLHPFVNQVIPQECHEHPSMTTNQHPRRVGEDLDPSLVSEMPSCGGSEDSVYEGQGFCLDELQNNTLMKQQWAIELEKELKEMKDNKKQNTDDGSLF